MHESFPLPAQCRGELRNWGTPIYWTAVFSPPEGHVDLARADLLLNKQCISDRVLHRPESKLPLDVKMTVGYNLVLASKWRPAFRYKAVVFLRIWRGLLYNKGLGLKCNRQPLRWQPTASLEGHPPCSPERFFFPKYLQISPNSTNIKTVL